jgi:hypothetical protein
MPQGSRSMRRIVSESYTLGSPQQAAWAAPFSPAGPEPITMRSCAARFTFGGVYQREVASASKPSYAVYARAPERWGGY